MRRFLAMSAVLVLLFAIVVVAPVSARTRTDVAMTVITVFETDPDAFTADGLSGCESGWVFDGPAHFEITRGPGIFAGYKLFECDETTGFLVRLNARFGPGGAVGTWGVVGAWGDLAGMTGSGRLSGDPIENGIIDNYVGSVVL